MYWELLVLMEEAPTSPRTPQVHEPGRKTLQLPCPTGNSCFIEHLTKDHRYRSISPTAGWDLSSFHFCPLSSLTTTRLPRNLAQMELPKKSFSPKNGWDPPWSGAAPTQLNCHNREGVVELLTLTNISYTASERRRFVITGKKGSAGSNLGALLCIWMCFSLWLGMICFTWGLVTNAGLWA